MPRLIYLALTSLDGYIEDQHGSFDWAIPDEEVHAFVNDLQRPLGTYLYGRRMYEVMSFWETQDPVAGEPSEPPVFLDYAAIWQSAEKVVYSRTLETASSARTRIVREFDPAAVQQMKSLAGPDISIGGSELAAQVIKAGLVDEFQLILSPTAVGGGKRALPVDFVLKLELVDQRRFDNGMVYLRYRNDL